MSTSNAIRNNTNSSSAQGTNTMNTLNNQAFDLNAFLAAANDTQTVLDQVLANFEADSAEAGLKEIKRTAGRAIAAIRANTLRDIARKLSDNSLNHQVIYAAVNLTKSWIFIKRVDAKNYVPSDVTMNNSDYAEGRKTIADYHRDCLEYVLTQTKSDTAPLVEFDKFCKDVLAKFRLASDQEIDALNINQIEKDKRKKLRLVTPYMGNGIELIFTPFATLMLAHKGSMIEVGGETVVINRERRFSITSQDVINGAIESMSRVIIHGENQVENNGKSYSFPSTDTLVVDGILNKLFLLKMNKVSYDKLFTSNTKQKVLMLNKNHKLKDIEYPAVKLPAIYGQTGFVSSTEAGAGYVNDRVNINCLAEFISNGNINGVITSGDVNKAVSRNDKLEKDTWSLGKQKCFIVADATSAQDFNDFGPAPIIGNKALVMRTGLARFTSRMSEGGIKAVMNYHVSNQDGPVIVSPAAFKGGLLSALMLTIFKGTNLSVSQLYAMAKNNPEMINQARQAFEAQCTTIDFMGRELTGFYADLDLNISNAYFVEEFKYTGEDVDINELEVLMERSSDIFTQGNKTPSALRDKVMSMVVADPNFSAVEYIHDLVEKGTVVPKKPTTRYTASLFSQIAQWHGVDVAESLIDSLIKRLPKTEKATKKIAMTVLSGDKNPTKGLRSTVNLQDISNILKKHYESTTTLPLEDVDTYSMDILDSINELLIGDKNGKLITDKPTFFKIVCSGNEVLIPANNMFYDKIDEMNGKFLATGFLKDLLNSAKYCLDVTKTGLIINTSNVKGEGLKLEAEVQRRLFGKNLGYIETYGTYQIMLNKIGGSAKRDEVYMTELSLVSKEGGNVVQVNSVKHPAYFKDASAGFTAIKFSFGDSMIDFAYRKAVFMSTFTIMVTEDDVDGDARQFSDDGYVLPPFVGPLKEFNGKEFLAFLNDEQKSCRIIGTSLKLVESNMHDFHLALQGVSSAKANIGLFTSSKYKYESVLSGMIGQVFEGTDGNFYNVTEDDVYVICNTLSRLTQTEAMDNVKQNSADFNAKFISELVAPHTFNNLRVPSNADVLEVRNDYVLSVANRLQSELFDNWTVKASFGLTMAQALFHAAQRIEAKGTKYMDLFSARFQFKRGEEVMSNITTRSSSNEFNLSGYDLSDSADSDSMYAYVLNKFKAL